MNIFQIELMKMKRQRMWIIVLIAPALGCLLGSFNYLTSLDILSGKGNQWYQLWNQVTFFYGLFLYPILSGILAVFLCRVEHITGGWKQSFTLPVKNNSIFISKFILLMLLLAATQVTLFLFFVIIGNVVISDSMNLSFFIKAIFNGWITILPVAIFQLILAIKIKGFMFSLSVNIIFTLSSLAMMIMNVEQYYPFVLPSLVMAPPTETIFMYSWTYLYGFVCILSLILFIFGNKMINNSEKII